MKTTAEEWQSWKMIATGVSWEHSTIRRLIQDLEDVATAANTPPVVEKPVEKKVVETPLFDAVKPPSKK